MQDAYYLPVSPEDNQCWEIQRDDKFLIEADQANSFDIRTSDFSSPNVLRVSVIQKTPQLRGIDVGVGIDEDDGGFDDVENDNRVRTVDDSGTDGDSNVSNSGKSRIKDSESISCDAMEIEDTENLTECIWNDYTIPDEVTSLESNLHSVISQELMVADIVDEHLLHSASIDSEKVTILQTVSVDAGDEFLVTCRCCNENFTFHDLKLHIAEKSTEGYFSCDWCAEIFLLKDLNNHVLTHLGVDADHDTSQRLSLSPRPTWYDNTHYKADEISFTEAEKTDDGMPTAESTNSPFTCPLIDLPAQPVNESPTTKRVKTDFLDNLGAAEGNERLSEQTITNVSRDADTEIPVQIEKETTQSNVQLVEDDRKIQIQCPKCKEEYKFAEEAEIEAYIKKHVPTTYYKCGFCDTIVTDKNEFNEHMKNHTIVVESSSGNKFPYKCSYCKNLAFKTIEELTSHIEMHVPRNIFVCPKCSAQFVRENKKQEAVKIRQSTTRKDNTMNKLKTTPVLTPADKTTVRENFKCTSCAAVFRRQDDFNKHVKTHMMPDSKQEISNVKIDPSYCAYCSSELSSIAEIIVHIRKHTEERKLFPCSNCDKKTTSDRNSNGNNRGKENLCNYCLSQNNGNFRVHG